VKARRGTVITIATEMMTASNEVDHVFYVPETLECLSPLLSIIPLQMLAYPHNRPARMRCRSAGLAKECDGE
jgi:glucosamine 6-phosphate synthetase-like amidotransferase/phosphosugar isomerase protein